MGGQRYAPAALPPGRRPGTYCKMCVRVRVRVRMRACVHVCVCVYTEGAKKRTHPRSIFFDCPACHMVTLAFI